MFFSVEKRDVDVDMNYLTGNLFFRNCWLVNHKLRQTSSVNCAATLRIPFTVLIYPAQ